MTVTCVTPYCSFFYQVPNKGKGKEEKYKAWKNKKSLNKGRETKKKQVDHL